MKKTKHSKCKYLAKTSICVLIMTLLSISTTFCKAPNGFNYQAVLRNTSGEVRANADLIVEVSILHGSATGSSVYNETHNTTTNSTGLINLVIGSKDTTDFNTIEWADGPYFIQIEVDGSLIGTSQLLSVPYAKYATKAANVNATGIDGTLSPDRYSAYDDLGNEGKLNNNEISDILTRSQADVRYNMNVGFLARNTTSDNYATGHDHKVEFNETIFNGFLMYNKAQDRYMAVSNGIYNFSATVAMLNLETDALVAIFCYVNGSTTYRLSSCISGGTSITLNGSLTIELIAGDYVEIWASSSDETYSVYGDSMFGATHFSGHLVNMTF